jgi:hypothetical protein
VRLELPHFLGAQALKIVHAVGGGLRLILPQHGHFGLGSGDDQFAQAPMLHASLCAIAVQQCISGHAQPRLE